MSRAIKSAAVFAAIAVFISFAFAFASADVYAKTSIPAKVSGISKTYAGGYNYSVKWKKASKAKKYEVYRAASKNGKYKKIKTTAKLKLKVNVKPGKKAYIKVRAMNNSGNGAFSSKIYIKTPVKPGKATNLKKSYSGHYEYKVTWKKAQKATKYNIYEASSKSGKYSLTKTVKTNSYTAYVTPGKTKYIKIKALNGVTLGNYSSYIRISTPDEEVIAEGIPKYWNEEIRDAVERYGNEEKTSSFIYFTDPHWNANTKHSPDIITYLYDNLGMSLAVCGGDIIAGTHDNTSEAIKEIESFYGSFDDSVNLMTTTGNHDYNTSSSEVAPLTDQKLYELIYKKEKSFAEVSQYGRCAYTDDDVNKVRYISTYFDAYLNNIIPQMGYDVASSYPSEDELIWLKETVQSEKLDEDWTVVLFTHGYFNFVRKGKTPQATDTGARFAEYLLELEKDADTKADIGCWLVGHTHRDMQELISDEDNQIRLICTNCDTYVDGKASRGSGYWGGWTMTKGHDTEQVIDLVSLDTVNREIHMTRVGAGKDRSYSY